MQYLPVFLDLRAGPVLLAGIGELAQAKLRLLLSAGATVRWHDPDNHYDLSGVDPAHASRVERAPADPLTAELGGVIAVLCAGIGDMGVAMSRRARAAGIPVNVMDDMDNSTFIFPAIVDRGDVVVAIGTGGTAPVVARRLRERIEALVPSRIGELAGFIGRWRKTIHADLNSMAEKRRFWERVIDGPIGEAVLAGRIADAEAALTGIDAPAFVAQPSGHVALVGAGPGDPDLLTIKALRALQDADIIFYDDLVSQEILDRSRRDAARVPVGKRRGQPGVGQDEINRRLIEAARAGQRVVRLKGGDTFIFGRGGEEVEALREAEVSYTVVPGITAALGVAAEAELPLTYRNEALRVTFLTAHRAEDAASIDFPGLADSKTTIVAYMGIASASAIQAGLIAAGRNPATPAAVFVRATRPDGQSFVGELQDLSSLASKAGEGPALLVIGDVVARSAPWRMSKLARLLSKNMVAA
jgi:uroporphyrin-III C-methyltransferase / precorrin-2 dehydrogenase / sirohydrochlorin ferrochelatase